MARVEVKRRKKKFASEKSYFAGLKLDTNLEHVDLNFKIVCYYVNWAQFRPWIGAYTIDNVDPCLCTHIIFAFANITGNYLEPIELNDLEMYAKLRNLKQINWDVKVMLAIGGAERFRPFEEIAKSEANRKEFAQNVVSYLNAHKFDGLDVDWEFPTANFKNNFTLLLKELKDAFVLNTKRKLELSCALGAPQSIIDASYDIPAISNIVDFANLMTYDLHGAWDDLTGFQSALYGFDESDIFHQEWVVEKYLQEGLAAQKAMLGIPTYGRTFRLCNRTQTHPRAPSCGYPEVGPQTGTNGTLSYYEICRRPRLEKKYDVKQEVPYGYVDDMWVSYDDVRSIKKKKEFAKNYSLGGVMFWDLSTDDFCNYCGDGIYPLLKVFDPSLATTRVQNFNLIVTATVLVWVLAAF